MADQASSQEKTERATPKRLRDARRRGELPRSRELVTAGVVGAAVLALLAFRGGVAADAGAFMRDALSLDPRLLAEPARMPEHFMRGFGRGLWVVLPLLFAGFLAALLAPMALGGWNVSAEALKLDFGRLSPVKGFGRIFSWNSVVEVGKGFAKFAMLGGLTAAFVWSSLDEVLALTSQAPRSGMAHGLALALKCLAWLTGGLLAIAAVDAPYQVWTFQRKMRMTRQELREEFKETEGRPEVKSRIRRAQQEMSRRSMMEKVPTADVVVTNPTHYAVALQYSAGTMQAPKVVAKGADLMAQAIRELAAEHKIPIVSAPPLARALYRHASLDADIPVALYQAVAQILTYVYQLRAWKPGTPWPQAPVIAQVAGGEEQG